MQLICTWRVINCLYDIIPYSGWFKKTKKEVNKNKTKKDQILMDLQLTSYINSREQKVSINVNILEI
jgi:hypothetical protein